jgi:2-methylfumaryl-CoA isomerase
VLTPNQWTAMVAALGIEAPVAALEAETGVAFARSDHNRFVHREALFEIVQAAASELDYGDLAARLTRAGATFERYRTMHEAANDPVLVADNPLFGPSPTNPSGFAYPAARSFAHLGGREAGNPAPAPFLGQHSEEVLADRLGLSTAAIGALVDRGVVASSDQHNFRKKA